MNLIIGLIFFILAIIMVILIVIIIIYFLRKPLYEEFINDKILISIVTIDRDAYAIEQVYDSIKHLLNSEKVDLLIVCRESDTICIKKWKQLYPNVIIETVPHYNIIDRHNQNALVKKRNISRNFALNNDYDYLFFIDSDIIINRDTLYKLVVGCKSPYSADICLIPYDVKWLNHSAIGIVDPKTESGFNIKKVEYSMLEPEKYIDCAIGGMGCTLLNRKALTIPFENIKLKNGDKDAFGEDIGYFVNAYKNGLSVKYLKNHIVKHL